jgi:uncharacterized C2H2 Zn-finger protein
MDLQQRAREPCSGCNDSSHRPNSPNGGVRSPSGTTSGVTTTTTTTGVKRSFDVAFLCAPDTKLSKLQHEQERSHNLSRKSAFTKVSKETSPERGMSPYDVTSCFAPKHFQQQHKSFSPFSLPQPGFLLNSGREKLLNSYLSKQHPPRSAYGYGGGEKELLNIAHPLLYPAEAYISAAYPSYASNFMSATSPPPSLGHQGGMSREMSRPSQVAISSSSSPPVAPFLSVAVSPVSALLPPSLAALSLPSQNVCAKCNLSFRMTSDLVYHMRSHHKQEAADPLRRKREEKLKCPVCSESFRERHHLTRHMTAHQDKAGDREDSGELLINAASGSQIAGK